MRWAEPCSCFPGNPRAAGIAGTARFAHLVQHGVALGALPLPQQNQPRDDVGGDDVQVPEKFRKKVGDLGVGILQKPGREGLEEEEEELECGKPQNRTQSENWTRFWSSASQNRRKIPAGNARSGLIT